MKNTKMNQTLLTLGLLAFLPAGFTEAAERRFAYSYGASPFTPGSLELETWATWKTGEGFDRIDFRHELEWGVSERLQLGLYFADWRWQDGEGSSFHDVALEAIYNLTDPNEDWIGSSLYGEIKGYEDFLELESKMLLQKDFGPLSMVYNVGLEAEWEGAGLEETKGEFVQTLGLSYLVKPSLGVGAELLHEIEIPEWEEAGNSALYIGPNVTLRSGRLWATVAGLWQVSGIDEEPDFQLRTLVGLHF